MSRAAGLLNGGDDRAVDRRNAMIAFSVRVGSAGLLFLSQVALARWMGADSYGIYVYAWTVVLVLGGISASGLNIGAIRIVSELRERRELDLLRGFLLGSRLLVLAVSSAVTLLALVFIWLISPRIPPAVFWPLAIIVAALPAFALTDLQDGICRGGARIASGLLAPYIIRPLLVLSGIGLWHAVGFDLDAVTAVKVAVIATWLAWAAQTAMVAREFRSIAPAGDRAYDAHGWTATTAPLFVMSVFDLAMQNIDVIVISNLLSPTDAGIYFAGAKTMGLIMFVHYAVGSSMANRFAAISTRGDVEAMRIAVRDAVRWTFWPSLVLALVMLALGHQLLSLFGPRFTAAYPVMCVLAVAVLCRAAIGPAESLLNMTGGQRDCARSLVIAALTNVTLSLVLTPLFGILGAAVAVTAAMAVGALLNWRAVRRNLGLDVGVWATFARAPRQI